jgi:hypothetical protein
MVAALRPAALALLLALLPAVPALAHEGNPDYRSEIEQIEPPVEGLDAEILNFDDSVRLENRSGETVLVEGYENEPYARLDADGTVEVNRRSPAYYLNTDRYAEAEVPASADPEATPEWEEVDGSAVFTWHDHRSHYMGTGTPPQVDDESVRTKVFDYGIPIEVGGQRGEIAGTLYWVGDDGGIPVAPFVGLGVLVVIALAVVLIVRRRRHGRDRESSGKEREAW